MNIFPKIMNFYEIVNIFQSRDQFLQIHEHFLNHDFFRNPWTFFQTPEDFSYLRTYFNFWFFFQICKDFSKSRTFFKFQKKSRDYFSGWPGHQRSDVRDVVIPGSSLPQCTKQLRGSMFRPGSISSVCQQLGFGVGGLI